MPIALHLLLKKGVVKIESLSIESPAQAGSFLNMSTGHLL